MRRLAAIAVLLGALGAEAGPRAMRFLVRNKRVSAPAAVDNALLRLALTGDCEGTAPTGTTFTRSSSATCVKANGQMVTLAANQPRRTSLGYLSEPSGTNQLLWSAELQTPANWIVSGTVTVTANVGAAPDLTTTAERITFPTVGAETTALLSQTITPPSASGANTYSLWARTESGACTFYLWDAGNSANASYGTCAATSSAWSRCTYTFTGTGNSSANVRLGFDSRATAEATPTGGNCSVLVTAAQAESGSVATSYIATAGAVATRTADVLTVPTPAGLSRTEGCARLAFTPQWTGNSPAAVHLLCAAGAADLFYSAATANIGSYNGSVFPAVNAGFVAGASKTYRTSWSAAGNFLRPENVTAGTSASSAFATLPVFNANTHIGSHTTGGLSANGHLSNVVLGAAPGDCL